MGGREREGGRGKKTPRGKPSGRFELERLPHKRHSMCRPFERILEEDRNSVRRDDSRGEKERRTNRRRGVDFLRRRWRVAEPSAEKRDLQRKNAKALVSGEGGRREKEHTGLTSEEFEPIGEKGRKTSLDLCDENGPRSS